MVGHSDTRAKVPFVTRLGSATADDGATLELERCPSAAQHPFGSFWKDDWTGKRQYLQEQSRSMLPRLLVLLGVRSAPTLVSRCTQIKVPCCVGGPHAPHMLSSSLRERVVSYNVRYLCPRLLPSGLLSPLPHEG